MTSDITSEVRFKLRHPKGSAGQEGRLKDQRSLSLNRVGLLLLWSLLPVQVRTVVTSQLPVQGV